MFRVVGLVFEYYGVDLVAVYVIYFVECDGEGLVWVAEGVDVWQ